jgi:hypothetical protein
MRLPGTETDGTGRLYVDLDCTDPTLSRVKIELGSQQKTFDRVNTLPPPPFATDICEHVGSEDRQGTSAKAVDYLLELDITSTLRR